MTRETKETNIMTRISAEGPIGLFMIKKAVGGVISTHGDIFYREMHVKTMQFTSSHQFEENIILLETMANIKNRDWKESTQISYTMFLQRL